MFRQTDKKWSNITMTSHADLNKLDKKEALIRWGKGLKDTLGRYGCLVTALTNAHNYYYNDVRTPEYFNSKLRENNGYYALYYGYDCPVGKESFLVWDVAKKVFGFKYWQNVDKSKIDIDDKSNYFVARVPYDPPKIMSGHYNLIVGLDNGVIKHCDSDTGVIRTDWKKPPDYRVVQITF